MTYLTSTLYSFCVLGLFGYQDSFVYYTVSLQDFSVPSVVLYESASSISFIWSFASVLDDFFFFYLIFDTFDYIFSTAYLLVANFTFLQNILSSFFDNLVYCTWLFSCRSFFYEIISIFLFSSTYVLKLFILTFVYVTVVFSSQMVFGISFTCIFCFKFFFSFISSLVSYFNISVALLMSLNILPELYFTCFCVFAKYLYVFVTQLYFLLAFYFLIICGFLLHILFNCYLFFFSFVIN
jgi:hypothetical protein